MSKLDLTSPRNAPPGNRDQGFNALKTSLYVNVTASAVFGRQAADDADNARES